MLSLASFDAGIVPVPSGAVVALVIRRLWEDPFPPGFLSYPVLPHLVVKRTRLSGGRKDTGVSGSLRESAGTTSCEVDGELR